MDGKGRVLDNIFVERLWRSVKYEDIYLKAYTDGRQLEAGLQAYFEFYNCQRFHQALAYQTPEQVFKEAKSSLSQVANKINRSGGPVTISLFNKVVRFQGRSINSNLPASSRSPAPRLVFMFFRFIFLTFHSRFTRRQGYKQHHSWGQSNGNKQ